MKDIMLDLETLGTDYNAAIIAVGAVAFDDTYLGKSYYTPVDFRTSIESGASVNASTIEWWMKQPDESRLRLFDTPIRHYDMLHTISDFIRQFGDDVRIWGNGSDFDNVILANAFKRNAIQLPWSHKNNRCYRTMKNLRPDIMDFSGTKHNALDDAKNQALHLIKILRNIK